MLIVGHAAVEDNNYIDVAPADRPEAIHARSGRRDRDLALEQVRLRTAISVVESVINASYDLIARLKIHALHALFLVHDTYYLLCTFQSGRTSGRLPTIEAKDHMGATHLLVLLYLLAQDAFFVPRQVL